MPCSGEAVVLKWLAALNSAITFGFLTDIRGRCMFDLRESSQKIQDGVNHSP